MYVPPYYAQLLLRKPTRPLTPPPPPPNTHIMQHYITQALTHLTLSESEASGRCLDAASSSLSWLTWSAVSVTGPSGVTPSRGFRGCWKMSDRGTVELSSAGCRDAADSTAAFNKPPAEGQSGGETYEYILMSIYVA